MQQLKGTYNVTRQFSANTCGYTTFTGQGALSTDIDGIANRRAFDFQTSTPYLSHMEYRGTVNTDRTLSVLEVDPAFYDARMTGSVVGSTMTFTEAVIIYRNDSPCDNVTVNSTVTVTKIG